MKAKFLLLGISLLCGKVMAQSLEVEQGAYLRLGRGVLLAATAMNIDIAGELLCDTGAVLAIGGKDFEATLSAAHPLALATLRIDGNTTINAAQVNIAGDIALNSGILNLGAASVHLRGNIVNENESGYIKGGRILKTLSIKNGQWLQTGMGLGFVSNADYDSLQIIRTHERQRMRSQQSIAKVYEFENSVLLTDIDFAYLNAFALKPADTYLLYYQDIAGSWESIDAITNAGTKRVNAKLGAAQDVKMLTIFPFPQLNFTKLLTPNNDGINDYFEVTGIEKYENNKLVILHNNGKIIYEMAGYANDFNGDGMSDGTYYFMFFGSKNDAKPLKKGFFELLRQ